MRASDAPENLGERSGTWVTKIDYMAGVQEHGPSQTSHHRDIKEQGRLRENARVGAVRVKSEREVLKDVHRTFVKLAG